MDAGDGAPQADDAAVAWRGEQRYAKYSGASIRFFKRAYENPRPDIEVSSIDFEPTLTTLCVPELLAMTVE